MDFNIALNVLILLLAAKVVLTIQYVHNVRQEHIWLRLKMFAQIHVMMMK